MPNNETGADLAASKGIEVQQSAPNQQRRAQQLDEKLSQSDFRAFSESTTVSDPYQAVAVHRTMPRMAPPVRFGWVQMAMPFTNWYRVAIDNVSGVVPCCRISADASTGLIGPRDISVIAPDTRVLVILHRTGRWGYILAALSPLTQHANDIFPDYVVQGSNVGSRREGYYKNYIKKLSDRGGVLDFSSGRPVDETLFSWGRMAETGVGIHVDPFLFETSFAVYLDSIRTRCCASLATT
jgi:hypothetical protein